MERHWKGCIRNRQEGEESFLSRLQGEGDRIDRNLGSYFGSLPLMDKTGKSCWTGGCLAFHRECSCARLCLVFDFLFRFHAIILTRISEKWSRGFEIFFFCRFSIS